MSRSVTMDGETLAMDLTGVRRDLTEEVKAAARAAGFDAVGIAPAVAGLRADRLADWLGAGKQGEMTYMLRQQSARENPELVLPGVRSVVVVALAYRTDEPAAPTRGNARVSRYAWGRDYHELLREGLLTVGERLDALDSGLRWRAVVDSAPIMERDFAQLAGLGWIGKNTLLLNQSLGSWFFLGALLVDAELNYDAPFESDHCGSCTRCLDACPTQAFDGPYQLDPRRCISYLTIEHRSQIPFPLRSGIGQWVFGCDVCQDVCPWNSKAPASSVDAFHPREKMNPAPLQWLLGMDDVTFRRQFRGTPLFRAKRNRLIRNACIAAGNQGDPGLLPELHRLSGDPDPVIVEAAKWAMERIAAKPPAQLDFPA